MANLLELKQEYYGCEIYTLSSNYSGLRYAAYVCGMFVYAQTLDGIKAQIRYELTKQ